MGKIFNSKAIREEAVSPVSCSSEQGATLCRGHREAWHQISIDPQAGSRPAPHLTEEAVPWEKLVYFLDTTLGKASL